MSKYSHYRDFMGEVMTRADTICREKGKGSLESYYNATNETNKNMRRIIDKTWSTFAALDAIFNAPVIFIAAVIAAFLITPTGVIIVAIFGLASKDILLEMYRHKELPNAVREVGKKYHSDWKSFSGNRYKIDSLLEKAANDLAS